jgi:FMN phosphatase YigB (HAD superfamily)
VAARRRTVILIDVDNTLLNNDAVVRDLRRHLRSEFGPHADQRYFKIFEKLRTRLGYTDYLGALQRYRVQHPTDPDILGMSAYLINYRFDRRLFPQAIRTLQAARAHGLPVILSDGDAVFQPHKVRRSGLWDAVGGRVLIYVHKEKMLRDIQRRYPADHYVLVDDKLRILAAMKRQWKKRLTTVFVRQGHYAVDPKMLKKYPPADRSIARIRDLNQVLRNLA